ICKSRLCAESWQADELTARLRRESALVLFHDDRGAHTEQGKRNRSPLLRLDIDHDQIGARSIAGCLSLAPLDARKVAVYDARHRAWPCGNASIEAPALARAPGSRCLVELPEQNLDGL